jgi:hypothetical protein
MNRRGGVYPRPQVSEFRNRLDYQPISDILPAGTGTGKV